MRKSGITLPPGLGGNLDLMRRLAKITRIKNIKPWIRKAHAHPSCENSLWSMSGKMTPPTLPPAAAIPVALARFAMNQCPIADMAGVKTNEVPTPPSTLKTSMKCQYALIC